MFLLQDKVFDTIMSCMVFFLYEICPFSQFQFCWAFCLEHIITVFGF